MIIREAIPSDLELILMCFEESIIGSCTEDYTDDQISAWVSGKNNLNRWEKAIEKQYFLVVEEHNKILAFASLDSDIIDFMYVSPRYQGLGLANNLFKRLELKAIEKKYSTLYTYASKTAKPFFSKIGFEVVRENIVDISDIKLKNYFMEKRFKLPYHTHNR